MSVVPRQCVPLGKKQSPGEPSQISRTYRQPWQLMYAEARLTQLATLICHSSLRNLSTMFAALNTFIKVTHYSWFWLY